MITRKIPERLLLEVASLVPATKTWISRAVIVTEYQAAFQKSASSLSFCENYADHKPEHMLIINGSTIFLPKQVESLSVKVKSGNVKTHLRKLTGFKVDGRL